MRAPLVSVAIPTFNGRRFIRETLASALSQTLENVEIVVVDDGSTDSTPEILAEYGSRITVVRQANGGIAAARNAAIQAASGDWIALLDHDDLWDSNKLERQMAYLQAHPECALVYARARTLGSLPGARASADILGAPPDAGRTMYETLLVRNPIPALTAIFARDVALELGGFRREFAPADDCHLWLRIAGEHEVGFLPEVLATYRRHEGNHHYVSIRRALEAADATFEAGVPFVRDPAARRAVETAHYCHAACMWAGHGFTGAGVERLRRAWRLEPFRPNVLRATRLVARSTIRNMLGRPPGHRRSSPVLR